MSKLRQFLQDAETKAFDQGHRATIKFNIGKYNAAVQRGLTQYSDHELARERGSFIKTNTINNLDKYLMEFEANFTARGGKVIWARDAQEALKEIGEIMKRKRARSVVKSKSMITEEIHLNEYLEKNGIETVETDLGEYIVQLAEQRPYHIVTPAMHMSKKDIADLFVRKLGIPPTENAEELVGVARKLLREKYTSAEVGITGGNFLIADVGGVAVTENEGNARLSTTFPKTHIAIVGIEKMIPSIMDLDLFWPLLSTSGTGQNVTVYNSIFTGPRQPKEADGPEEMYVVLLDNGRTDLLALPEKREALNCIRCGACLNVCPVYKNIGGHTYETTYSGPIGSVISPHYNGMAEHKHLSFASSLCGACTSVCPVKINIHNLLLLNRKQSVDQGMADSQETTAFKFWLKAMKSRKLMNIAPASVKNFVLRYVQKDTWSKRREPLQAPKKSFNQLWKEQRG
ncbi:LutB/LldF family L-lactate oxidation iron-sulfur protein [Pontibacter actiniarum]|uniref:Iron-sulfur cluster-binding protein n=1 Tax=Pontibacter actiniarum TaxID=323450 RepID=A0A1X9YYX4_9BACT|nr:LutB/LldF family L-lactate oxidation iron-sulfur protein [Pontibacter actiniarum]ARS37944.1 iron-sulfur cluster-binding protein [Pontibacter actiniarum]